MQLLTSYTLRFGRISRGIWLGRIAGLALFCTAFGMLAEWAFGSAGAAAFAFVFVWSASALSAQRLHDRGRSAWWLFLLLAPVIGPIWLTWQLLRRGDAAANAYGDNPAVRSDYLQVDIAR
jgi:uncharacterized membrane protein YhaH (DUF805 family)